MNYLNFVLVFFVGMCTPCILNAQTIQSDTIKLSGIDRKVEICVDTWGIAHIYAQNEHDLFFAQGFNAARDRLFQLEIWRRQALGTVAELLGKRELQRDIGTRLFKFRGNMEQEMNHYHPRGNEIITQFVNGVNAYIELTRQMPELLPVEFELLDTQPEFWTPEVVVSRHQGLLGNITDELEYVRLVKAIGGEDTQGLMGFHPNKPDLTIDPKLEDIDWDQDILGIYNAFRRPVRFQSEDLAMDLPTELQSDTIWALEPLNIDVKNDIGSNNWVVSGKLTQSGYPIMANDPHRTQAVPSLRYWAHLHAPGWNVIGGGEPEIPGISIGHNEHGAWGLTVFNTDAEDLYVYETNPQNPDQYWYNGQWEDMKLIEDTIKVKGQEDIYHTYKYTRHGPVVFENTETSRAFAIRAGWMEIGGSPYLASLRMDQADTWESFREACTYSHIPGENMIWADKEGNIGWQAVGIAPVRENWSGLIPVPGDGRYEWSGYLPIQAKPHVVNPEEGFISTANQQVTPREYEYPEALGYEWADPYRGNRLKEVLGSGRIHSLMDMMRLQTDYVSIPARTLTPLLFDLDLTEELNIQALEYLRYWDFRLNPGSVAAGIYVAWERALVDEVRKRIIPDEAKEYISWMPMRTCIDALTLPSHRLGAQPLDAREELLISTFIASVNNMKEKFGTDMSNWVYGQENYKHIRLTHSLGNIVEPELQNKLNVGPLPRGGNSFTVNNTASGNNQSSGASFRIIVDLADWDKCVGMNSPGQSGDPDSPHYNDLFKYWAEDQFFPVAFSRKKVEEMTEKVIVLVKKP